VILKAATNTILDSGGIDEVRVDGDYTLADGLENLTLTKAGSVTTVATGNSLANVLTGSEGSDRLEGLGGNDILRGGSERDFLRGGEGNDQLFGGEGNDDLSGDAGNDVLTGGKGDDVYAVLDATDKAVEIAGEGYDSVVSYVESYTLATNVEHLILGGGIAKGSGNAGDNVLDGNNAANQLDGAAGNDSIYALDGDDTLSGGSGDDWLFGENGKDTIVGGAGGDFIDGGLGADTLTGGAGSDRFYYGVDQLIDLANLGGDKIIDFEVGKDKLEMGALFNEFNVSDDPLGDGFLKFEVNGKDTKVLFDADGGGDDFITLVTLVGVTKAGYADVSIEA
jgi:Ca2+-binding RTX toxin-like protein